MPKYYVIILVLWALCLCWLLTTSWRLPSFIYFGAEPRAETKFLMRDKKPPKAEIQQVLSGDNANEVGRENGELNLHHDDEKEQQPVEQATQATISSPTTLKSTSSSTTTSTEEMELVDKPKEVVEPRLEDDVLISGAQIVKELNGVSSDDAPRVQRLHGWLGYKHGVPMWEPTPLKKPLREWTDEENTAAHKGYCFNVVMSDSLELDREFGDYRHEQCKVKAKEYESQELGPASVIITFFNEALSPLLRSIHSILNTAKPEQLAELILIDDGSDVVANPWLGKSFEDYVMNLPKVHLRRLAERSGLMKARIAGADAASTKILIFLDSHIECNVGWLEPLLAHVHENYRNVGVPNIDSIDFHHFTGSAGGIGILGHSWTLGQSFLARSVSEFEPNPSPIMAGGLFIITKQWFDELGRYDPEFQQYGGEEMEISFKIWQCGGTLKMIPCARIGHVFRNSKYWKGQAYLVDNNLIVRNKLRAADVWMDEFADIAYLAMATLPDGYSVGDTSEQKRKRKELGCKSYQWYHENVFQELKVPFLADARIGSLVSIGIKDSCLDTLGASKPTDKVGPYPCHWGHGSQAFIHTGEGQLQVATNSFEKCIIAKYAALRPLSKQSSGYATIGKCDDENNWTYDPDAQTMRSKKYNTCMKASRSAKNDLSPYGLVLDECSDEDATMKWKFYGPAEEKEDARKKGNKSDEQEDGDGREM